jgi:hypothetical protein
VTMVERNVEELSHKIEANSKLYENSVEEGLKKIDRTEMDDLKNGMEKERCKINYFQDKISNIAKSVEGVKIETNNMSKHKLVVVPLNESIFQEINSVQT